jgi:asparagine synthase (glutamine-hydrolysing)
VEPGPAALAHGARWTTPESQRERQPFASGAGNVIVADARLDNRRDLITALGLTGGAAGDVGDGELILRAYERCRPCRGAIVLASDLCSASWWSTP